MSWTNPKTWFVLDQPPAADFNTYIRDNTSFLYNAPSCRISKNSDVSIPDSSQQVIAFGNESWDPFNMHTSTNSTRITFAVAGVYSCAAGVKWAGASTGQRMLRIQKNGGVDLANASMNSTGATISSHLNVKSDFLMAPGDYIEAYVYQNSGSGLNVNGGTDGGAWMSATWISSGSS